MRLQGLQRRALGLVGGFLTASASAATVMTTNFIVDAPTATLAQQVASRAEQQRRVVAQACFQGPLPAARLKTLVRVTLREDSADCHARTLPAREGAGHLVVLAGPLDEVAGPSLDHEVLHATLADGVGRDFPAWLNEGLACRFDNARLRAIRQRELHDMALEATWPDIEQLLSEPIRTAKQYAVAESLAAFLLTKCEPHELVAFGIACEHDGTPAALRTHLNYSGVSEFTREWQQHVLQELTTLARAEREIRLR